MALSETDPEAKRFLDRVEPKPESSEFDWFLTAFFQITSDRTYTVRPKVIHAGDTALVLNISVPCPLPYSAISNFAKDHNITGEAFKDFLTIIRHLDNEYRELIDQEIEDGGE